LAFAQILVGVKPTLFLDKTVSRRVFFSNAAQSLFLFLIVKSYELRFCHPADAGFSWIRGDFLINRPVTTCKIIT
jgi:hypothetical protein